MTAPLKAVSMVVPVNQVPETVTDPEKTAHQIQAMSEGVPSPDDTITFLDEEYRIADRVGLMPLMKFARSAKAGSSTEDEDGLVALYDLLKDSLHPDDWDRFERDSITKKADGEELMGVVTTTIAILSARPTRRRSVSSSTPSSTGASSTDASSPGLRLPEGWEEMTPVSAVG